MGTFHRRLMMYSVGVYDKFVQSVERSSSEEPCNFSIDRYLYENNVEPSECARFSGENQGSAGEDHPDGTHYPRT